jgi:hypothetical protein
MNEEKPAQPSNRRLHLLFAVAVLIGALILLIAYEWASVAEKEKEKLEAPKEKPAQTGALENTPAAPGPTAQRAFAVRAATPALAAAGERSTLADTLNQPGRTGRDDLAVVAELFANYREQFREMPVGTNAEITAALAGDNPRGHAVLPRDHAAINPAGELTDRWGTPYFFHQLAGDLMEIRSAGPDRRMHNGDDLVWPPEEAMLGGTSQRVEPARSLPGRVAVAANTNLDVR